MEQKNVFTNVGDTIKIISMTGINYNYLIDKTAKVTRKYPDGSIDIDLKFKDNSTVNLFPEQDSWEIIEKFSSLPTSTTTEQSVIDESNALASAIDEAIFYNNYNPIKTKAKPVEVLGALIHLLVDKGVLSSKDAGRILVNK